MVKGLKVSVDLNLDAVSSPGTVLGTRGPLYIEMQIFRHVLRSEASPSIFPVLLHKRLNITHIFPYLTDPWQLASELAKQMISIKLIQEGALGDQILAHYAASARDFLFPTPSLSDTYPGVHREILMNRTQFYTGLLEPKLEFSTKTVIKEVTARRKFGGTAITNRVRSPSPVRGRGAFEMSKTDDRLTRTAAKNLQQAIETQQSRTSRSRSAVRRADDPRFMDTTVSFRAKSPERRVKSAKKSTKKPLPFVGANDNHNLARYTSTYTETKAPPAKSRHTTVTDLDYRGNTYEKIRQRISRLLESPRAQEFNRHGELDASLVRLERKIAANKGPRVNLAKDCTWSEDASKYRGESHRQTFDASLKHVYDGIVEDYQD